MWRDAGMDGYRNGGMRAGKGVKDTAILVVSVGTSYNQKRDLTIDAIETTIAEAFPDYEVRRAFTSQIIIGKLKERDGVETDNVGQALNRAAADGITNLVVQPTYLSEGCAYINLADIVEDYKDRFRCLALGKPLLSDDADYEAVITSIVDQAGVHIDGRTAVCLMGHGTEAGNGSVYAKLQKKIVLAGHKNYYIGTLKGKPTLEDIVAALKEEGVYKKVFLAPLMIVAGVHAFNDMAGAGANSWKTVLERSGYGVECLCEGLGQFEAIRSIYVRHVQEAVSSLKLCR